MVEVGIKGQLDCTQRLRCVPENLQGWRFVSRNRSPGVGAAPRARPAVDDHGRLITLDRRRYAHREIARGGAAVGQPEGKGIYTRALRRSLHGALGYHAIHLLPEREHAGHLCLAEMERDTGCRLDDYKCVAVRIKGGVELQRDWN